HDPGLPPVRASCLVGLPLAAETVRSRLGAIVARHDIFATGGAKGVSPEFISHDWTRLDDEAIEGGKAACLTRLQQADLNRCPLFVMLAALPGGRAWLLIGAVQSRLDGFSCVRLLRDRAGP